MKTTINNNLRVYQVITSNGKLYKTLKRMADLIILEIGRAKKKNNG